MEKAEKAEKAKESEGEGGGEGGEVVEKLFSILICPNDFYVLSQRWKKISQYLFFLAAAMKLVSQ